MNKLTPSSPFTLAVCAEMIFCDLPVLERVKRISELGFQVEIWDWTKHDIDALANSDVFVHDRLCHRHPGRCPRSR